jgi:sulfatase modifying factor 1
MMRRSFAWAVLGLLAVTTAGCGVIIGLDQDYREGSAVTGSGGSGSGSGNATTGGSGSSGSSSSAGGASPTDMPSCRGLEPKCGPEQNEDCCTTLPMPAGDFHRDGIPDFPATVSSFFLDRFEVTVGRFRKFVEAYSQDMTVIGSGKNLKVPQDTGWDQSFNSYMVKDRDALKAALVNCVVPKVATTPVHTWTDIAGDNEEKPINCVHWYEAYAFCIWDGGRLPTEVEWGYAWLGGNLLRPFPWGDKPDAPDAAVIDCSLNGTSQPCTLSNISRVGSLRDGDGLWKQADLAGNMSEWVRDTWADAYPPPPCEDCANVVPGGTMRVYRGGSWIDTQDKITSTYRWAGGDQQRPAEVGFRCARD